MDLFIKSEIKSIINNYNKYFFYSLHNNANLLVQAFTIYYGKEYQAMINDKISNTYFFNFISNTIIDLMATGYSELDKFQKYQHRNFEKIINYYKKKKSFFKFFDDTARLSSNLKKQIIKLIKNSDDSFAFQLSNIDPEHKPIYTIFYGIGVNDETIIHEINHVITNSILAYQIDDKGVSIIERIGTTNSLSMNEGEALEEVLNDKASCEIADIFHKLGGRISCYNLYPNNTYQVLFPLIDKFYYKYSSLLKKARISDNQNILFTQIDKICFEKYQKFITDEMNYVCKNQQISPNAIKRADELFKKLEKIQETESNINIYIKQLQNKKRIIKLLTNNYDKPSKISKII